MDKREIEKIIQKKNIKEANGLDTSEEEMKILSAFVEMSLNNACENSDDDMSVELKKLLEKNPVPSPLPYIICKEQASLYFELTQKLKEQGLIVLQQNCVTPEFLQAFDLLDEFFCLYYGEQLLSFADWALEKKLDGISIDDVPEYDKNRNKYDQIYKLIQMLEQVNKQLIPILETHNKGKCMCFYPLVHNILLKISFIMEQ